MLYTQAPSTWPAGSNPTLRIAANSSEVSAEPHVPLRRISAIRASATAGSSSLTVLAPYVRASRSPSRATGRSHGHKARARWPVLDGAHVSQPNSAPGYAGRRLILSVPFLVSALHRLQRAGGLLRGGIGAQPVLARGGSVVVFHGVACEAVPPSLLVIHGH